KRARTAPAKAAEFTALAPNLRPPTIASTPRPASPTTKQKKLPLVAVKPKKATRPSLPLPPPPPKVETPPVRDEMPAPRDIARLTRYGERFGAHKIDVR